MAEEIKIDMDKPCQKCGVMGAAGNGLCLSCTADNLINWENLIGEALVCGNKEIYNLLAAHRPQIHRAYLMSEDGKLSIGMSIDLAPSDELPNAIVFRSKINFIESRVRDEKTGHVSAQQKLPM